MNKLSWYNIEPITIPDDVWPDVSENQIKAELPRLKYFSKEVLVERWANEFDKRSDYANVTEESSLLYPEQHPESMYELEEERIKLFIKEIIEDVVEKLSQDKEAPCQ